MCRLTVALASAFIMLTLFVQAGVVSGIDRRLDRHLDLLGGTNWSWLAVVADPFVTAALFAAGFLVLRRRSQTQQAWAWVLALVIGLIVEVAFKAWVDQIPFAPAERIFDLVSLSNTYPSGHAMRAVLLAGLATAVMPRYAWVWVSYAAFVVVWVVVSGMHLVSDAAGGALLGATLVTAVNCHRTRALGRARGAGVVD